MTTDTALVVVATLVVIALRFAIRGRLPASRRNHGTEANGDGGGGWSGWFGGHHGGDGHGGNDGGGHGGDGGGGDGGGGDGGGH